MKAPGLAHRCLWLGALVLLLPGRAAWGYVEAPFTLGKIINDSTNVLLVRVESVDKEKNLIVYRKVRDIKGQHPGDVIKHNIGRGGFNPREWQYVMAWAEVGQTAVFFHNGGAGETCINGYWYQVYAGEWWALSHGEPFLLRSYCGKPDKLAGYVAQIVASQEVVVPCMVDGDKNTLHLRTAKLQRMKASLKLQDYNAARDFAGWGAEEIRAIAGLPGFSHFGTLSRVSPGAWGVATADINGDGKPDLCLFGEGRACVLQNEGNSFGELPLGLDCGARAAAWADYNGDGKPDLLLATPLGPRLFLNEGEGKFRDATSCMPYEDYYHVTAAAWMDYDGDKRPDILLADGFRGLRLYRNKGAVTRDPKTPRIGPWYYAGPFDSPGGNGFATVHPPEKEIDLKKEYPGKNNEKVVWREGKFNDGEVNNLALFNPACNENAVVYLYRELDFPAAAEIPVSLGSDDALAVWLNGQQVLAENVARGCEPNQNQVTLKLKPGKNHLLLKVVNGASQWAFYFSAKTPTIVGPQLFEDVSERVGLGITGVGSTLKGDHLAVADVNGDGRPDFLYSAGTGLVVLNTPQGFAAAQDSGISYQTGRTTPVFGDFNGDGYPDLFVPQRTKCKLFRNNGKGSFTDVTAKAGGLAQPFGEARGTPTCAAWTDFNNRGRLDLLVGCLRGPNRYFRNNGNGTFTDASEELGLLQAIYNTRGIAALDLNKDSVADVIFVNEGQESVLLLGSPSRLAAGALAQK